MDYSFDIRLYPDLAVELWPEVGVVQWLFYNIFQFFTLDSSDNKGDCPANFESMYAMFESKIPEVPEWEQIPWGLGAWGSNQSVWGNKPIPFDEREHCLLGIRDALESGDYPRAKASIYFNSLESEISESISPDMIPTFQALQDSEVYYRDEEESDNGSEDN